MRNMSLLLPFAALSLVAAAPAHAEWYVGGNAGAVIQDDVTYKGNDPTDGPWSSKGTYDTGYGLMVNGGYDFGGPKAELELGYRNAGHKSLDGDSASGNSSSLSIMANGIYEFLPKSTWHPFLGAGIGMAQVSDDLKGSDGRTKLNQSDWQFAYQGIVGVSYDLNKSWSANAQYRYFATLDPSFTDSDGSKIKADYGTHNILAGLTYKFSK